MKITYYHTLYKREVTVNVFGEIEFKNNYVIFHSSGHGYIVDTKYIRKIEQIED